MQLPSYMKEKDAKCEELVREFLETFELSAVHHCAKCGAYVPSHEVEEQATTYGDWCCNTPLCDSIETKVVETFPDWVSVAMYSVRREWGGPEEGGWYYPVYTRDESTLRNFQLTSADDLREALDYHQRLSDVAKTHNTNATTARSEWDVRVESEKSAEPFYPRNRPHYC